MRKRRNKVAASYKDGILRNYSMLTAIGPSIDSGKIAARSQGIVTLTLPKAEEVKPRKIAVS